MILDACRENPFVKSMRRTVAARSVGRGLGRIEPSTGNTLIAFATKPNAIAEDGKGPNSPFTAALVKHLLTPGLDLRIALGRVRDDVLASTVSKQEPYVTGSLGGGVVSIAGAAPWAAVTVPAPQLSEVERTWAAVKDTTSISALAAFRRQYGAANPIYDRLAEGRIEDLKKRALTVQPRPPPVSPAPLSKPSERAAVEDCDRSHSTFDSRLSYSGVFTGVLEDAQGKAEVQIKVVRNGDAVQGSYWRAGLCGRLSGEVVGNRLIFNWSWGGASGRGVASQTGTRLVGTSGFDDAMQGGGAFVLLRR